jgi:hypothetical protein
MHIMPKDAAAAQDRAWKVRRFGMAEVQKQEQAEADAADRLAKAKQYTAEAPARELSAELNRNQLQLAQMLESQRLSDIRMQLQTEKSDWNPGEPYKPVAGDTPLSIQKKAEAAMKEFGELDREAQAVLVGFMQVNPSDLTNPAVWESAWDYVCSRLQPTPAPAGAEPEPVAVVEPGVNEVKNPFHWDDNPRSDYAKFEMARSRKALNEELREGPIRQSLENLGCDLSAEEVRNFINYFEAKHLPTTEASVRHTAIKVWGSRTNATPEELATRDYEASVDQASSSEMKAHFGFQNDYSPSRSGYTRRS